MKYYEYIIVGGGISGLYMGHMLKKQGKQFHLFERKPRLGGRIKSITAENLTYDSGALRISSKHLRVLSLVKELGLEKELEVYDNKIKYFINNKFSSTNKEMNNIINKLKYQHKDKKINNSLYSLASLYFSIQDIKVAIAKSGYNTEINNLNFYLYLKEHEIYYQTFYRFKNGLIRIIDKLRKNIDDNNITLKASLDSIKYKNEVYEININNNTLKCKYLILAIPPENLIKINYFKNHESLLNCISSNKYIRVYAIYPLINNKVWFEKISTIHTDLPIRKIVPIDKKKGLIMIAYMDGEYAELLNQININQGAYKFIENNLKILFPKIKIPKPSYFKIHYWNAGTHWWKPGANSDELIPRIQRPNKNMFIVGEAVSNNQGWMEGALESCHNIQKYQKYKTYSKIHVATHNTVDNAWVIFHNKVYDITKWIPKHPGGKVIEKFLGVDITNVFIAVNHSEQASTTLEQYFIGYLDVQ